MCVTVLWVVSPSSSDSDVSSDPTNTNTIVIPVAVSVAALVVVLFVVVIIVVIGNVLCTYLVFYYYIIYNGLVVICIKRNLHVRIKRKSSVKMDNLGTHNGRVGKTLFDSRNVTPQPGFEPRYKSDEPSQRVSYYHSNVYGYLTRLSQEYNIVVTM